MSYSLAILSQLFQVSYPTYSYLLYPWHLGTGQSLSCISHFHCASSFHPGHSVI